MEALTSPSRHFLVELPAAPRVAEQKGAEFGCRARDIKVG